ncbi:MAG: DUF3786 domain-containing protein [Anaerolineales bacterium]|nr:DUF3786 domain-containing protein [Anaerolineales bacterium]
MGGLTDRAAETTASPGDAVERAHQAWQQSMLRQVESLRVEVQALSPQILAARCGGLLTKSEISLIYWGKSLVVSWPDLQVCEQTSSKPASLFDAAMLLYYLHSADGSPLTGRWIGYRELPDGAFYSQAFQGYTGNRIASSLGERPEAFCTAAKALGGERLPALPGEAYVFLPLPRIPLAAILYPGDEEFPARASILFDAAVSHYMTTDGLALLGAGLTGRLIKTAQNAG